MGTSIPASATPHAEGADTELVASLAHDVYWVTIFFVDTAVAATATDSLVTLYRGAGGTNPLISNLLSGWSNSSATPGNTPKIYQFPLYIPAGTRISARSRALIASDVVRICYKFQGGGQPSGWCGRSVEALGADTANSRGTSVTAGTTAEGTFTAIGTTGFEYGYVLPMVGGNLADTTMTNNWIAADIGVGGAVLKDLTDWVFNMSTTEGATSVEGGMGRFTKIPSGTALQLRTQASDTSVEPKDYCIYGVY
jgi:hypothetical protein